VAQLKSQKLTFQVGLASDGILTFAEYDRLAHAFFQCVRDGGDEVNDLMLTVAHTYYFTVGTPRSGSARVVTDCNRKYWDPLAPLWSLHQSIPQNISRQADDALGQCLRDHNIRFPHQHPVSEDFRPLMGPDSNAGPTLFECQQIVDKEFKLPLTWAG
jgi:hypothetical protein